MSDGEMERWCRDEVASALLAQLKRQREQLAAQEERKKKGEDGMQGNGKYGVESGGGRVATFGELRDFHEGIAGKIGLPAPRLWEGMEAEHCRRKGCDTSFSPGNYDTTTTPEAEWLVATDAKEGERVSVGGRRVVSFEELMEHETVKKAGLRKEEVVALKLYTGPMFCLYNAVLRDFPASTVELLHGNTYTTTIYCIVSGIIKLSNVMKLPENRTVYRGLGGLELPEAFVKTDEHGVRGGVEFAMMSTTLERRVAVQYAGKFIPTVFEISVGAIDRGASLSFLSQYPREEEILLPPRSYLEVVGPSRVEVADDGKRIRVVTLKVNANVTSSTLEEIEGKRKELLVAAGEHATHEIRSKLKARIESEEVEKLMVHRPLSVEEKILDQILNTTISEVETWVAKHREKLDEWYNDDWQYAGATRELMQLEGMAMDKFQRWVDCEDSERDRLSKVRRKVESQMMARLDRMVEERAAETRAWVRLPSVVTWGPGSMGMVTGRMVGPEQREAALELCRRREILIESLEERNDLGEPPMVAAAAKGDVVNLKLLLAAGGWVDSVALPGRVTALHVACMMGNEEYVRALVAAGADVYARDHNGTTCLLECAGSGHLGVLRYLCEVGGKQLVMMVDKTGLSCARIAAKNDQLDALRVLYAVAGKELLKLSMKDGRTCAHAGAGSVEMLRLLHEFGGKELLMRKTNLGWTCAHLAAQNGFFESLVMLHDLVGKEMLTMEQESGGTCAHFAAQDDHVEILRMLHEKCGKEVLLKVRRDGSTCVHDAAAEGRLQALRVLHELAGKELFLRQNANGLSCAHIAAQKGNLEVLRFLLDVGGKELALLVDKNGFSCAHKAAVFGNVEALQLLAEVGGKDLLMVTSEKQASCAFVAAEKGHVVALRFLLEVGGKELLMLAMKDGTTSAYVATQNGHAQALRLLCEVGGKELLMKVRTKSGISCAHTAMIRGKKEAMRVLCEFGGKELLALADNTGRTPAIIAAANENLEMLQLFYEVGGKEVLMMVDKEGKSCAHVATNNARMSALQILANVCGKEVFMMAKHNGETCAHIAANLGELDVLQFLYDVGGKDMLMIEDHRGRSCVHTAALCGRKNVLQFLVAACGKEVLTGLDMTGASVLNTGAKHWPVCEYAAQEGGIDLLRIADDGGWTAFHRMLYADKADWTADLASMFGEEGAKMLETARTEVAKLMTQQQEAQLQVLRGWPSTVRMVAGEKGTMATFSVDLCTVRSRGSCPNGSRAYYEVEIVKMEQHPKFRFGFVSKRFLPIQGETSKGVGQELSKADWAVDGVDQCKWHGGMATEYACKWKEGDVIGLACDIALGKMHVSVNGDYGTPNGAVFDFEVRQEREALFAAFSAQSGQLRCNLGEGGPFKHSPPDVYGGLAYKPFADIASHD